jgi:hypothetical protein
LNLNRDRTPRTLPGEIDRLIMSKLALICTLLCVFGVAACSKKAPRTASPYAGKTVAPRTKDKPIITPFAGMQGKVASVNQVSRFAVITFPSPPLPQPGRVLSVYRAGLKVGEIRITPPAPIMLNVTGDITGEAAVGDEVREE